jgi:hypothetical protein
MRRLLYRIREMIIASVMTWKKTRYENKVIIYIVGYTTKESGDIVYEELEMADLRTKQRITKLNNVEMRRTIN